MEQYFDTVALSAPESGHTGGMMIRTVAICAALTEIAVTSSAPGTADPGALSFSVIP